MKQMYLVVINTLRHAMVVTADSNDELFNKIDEYVSPYSCMIIEEDELSVCFETDVVLDAKDGDIDIGDLIGPKDAGTIEVGDYFFEAISSIGDEIRKIRNGALNYDTEWMTFNNNHTDLIPFTQHKGFMSELIKNINELPLVHTPAGSTTENLLQDPDEMPSILERAMMMLIEKPQGITHYDVGCNSDDLGAMMFAIEHGYLESIQDKSKQEITH